MNRKKVDRQKSSEGKWWKKRKQHRICIYICKIADQLQRNVPAFPGAFLMHFSSFFLELLSLHNEFTFVFCSWRKYLRILIVCICKREREKEGRQIGLEKMLQQYSNKRGKRTAKIFKQFQNAIVKCFKRFLFECGEWAFGRGFSRGYRILLGSAVGLFVGCVCTALWAG